MFFPFIRIECLYFKRQTKIFQIPIFEPLGTTPLELPADGDIKEVPPPERRGRSTSLNSFLQIFSHQILIYWKTVIKKRDVSASRQSWNNPAKAANFH